MHGWSWVVAGLTSMAALGAVTEGPTFRFPQVERYGGIVRVPDAAEPPRHGIKIVFDITADSKSEELNKGLESVARYLNLNAEAGFKPADVKLALVLHGAATKAALNDAAYAKLTATNNNPNLELIRDLKTCGVEVFVCGQSLARNKFAPAEVDGDVTVAVSAMTVNPSRPLRVLYRGHPLGVQGDHDVAATDSVFGTAQGLRRTVPVLPAEVRRCVVGEVAEVG